MSSLVTRVPGVQCPVEDGPGAHTCVKAPTITASPLTTAWLYTMECLHRRGLGPNHCVLQVRLPGNTLGVHLTGAGETRLGSATPAGDTAAAVAAAGAAIAAGALTVSSPPPASGAVAPATAAVSQRRCFMCPPRRSSSHDV